MLGILAVISLVAGVILTNNGTTWFEGENTVGHILNVFGIVVLVIEFLIILWAWVVVSKYPKYKSPYRH